jgi:chaperonin GroEL
MALKRGIEKAVEQAVAAIHEMAKPVKGDAIAQVGTVSANGDTTIGGIIAEAMEKVGKDGVITVEEVEVARDHARGGRGYAVRPRLLSPYFVTDSEQDGGGRSRTR